MEWNESVYSGLSRKVYVVCKKGKQKRNIKSDYKVKKPVLWQSKMSSIRYDDNGEPYVVSHQEVAPEIQEYMDTFRHDWSLLLHSDMVWCFERVSYLPIGRIDAIIIPEDKEQVEQYEFVILGYGDTSPRRVAYTELKQMYPRQLAWYSNVKHWPLQFRNWEWTASEEVCPLPMSYLPRVLRGLLSGMFTTDRPDLMDEDASV